MTDFVPSGYVTLEEAVDRIGQCLMPHEWLGHEVDLLKRDSSVTEEGPAAREEAATADARIGRLDHAVNRLLDELSAGDIEAVVADAQGEAHAFPALLWKKLGIRAVFRSGELPVKFRTALEGHRAGAGKRWIYVPDVALRNLLERIAASQAVTDVEAEFGTWLATMVEEAAGKEPPTKKRIWMDAKGTFGSRLSYRAFDRVWRATVPDTWRWPTRPRRPKRVE